MASRCETIGTQFWDSKIGTAGDGTFKIGPDNGSGDFEGTHSSGQKIKGRCSASGIWFVMPQDDPQYLYKGIFEDDKTLRGKRTTLANPAIVENLVAGDDWVATKTT